MITERKATAMPTLCPWCREAFHPELREFHTCTIAPAPRPDHVKVRFSEDSRYLTIEFAWKVEGFTLDRPVVHGISCLPRYIHRLTRAFLEGQLYGPATIAWDMHAQTYPAATCKVYTKQMNKDLTRLGY